MRVMTMGSLIWVPFHVDGFEPYSLLSQHSNGLTKMDFELAHLCVLLEKKYLNDHDAGYTYIDPVTSESILLTPFIIKEWVCAMVNCSLLILNHWKLMHYYSMIGQYLLAIHHPLQHLIL
jgi:hypothetical protein